MVERRTSAWSDPKTWVSICGILLTISSLISGAILHELSTLSSKVESVLIAQQKQTSDSEALRAKELSDNEALKEEMRSVKEDIKALQEHDAGQERVIATINGALTARGGK